MPDQVNVTFVKQHLNVRLSNDNDDQQITIQARDRVELTVTDRVTVSQINLGGGGSSFLPQSDLCDDTGGIYFYFGWTSVSGSWLIRRRTRIDLTEVDATIANNGGFADLATAWASRASLNYA